MEHFTKKYEKVLFLLVSGQNHSKKGLQNWNRKGVAYQFWIKNASNQWFAIYWAIMQSHELQNWLTWLLRRVLRPTNTIEQSIWDTQIHTFLRQFTQIWHAFCIIFPQMTSFSQFCDSFDVFQWYLKDAFSRANGQLWIKLSSNSQKDRNCYNFCQIWDTFCSIFPKTISFSQFYHKIYVSQFCAKG